jgi:hypothetical protein
MRFWWLFLFASLGGCAFAQRPVISCGDLRALTNNEMSVAYAVVFPAAADAPEHCRVRGQILPQVGFEVNLPAQWNGRLHMSGNGGYAGDALDHDRRTPPRTALLQQGFATAVTDTGHSSATEPLGTFAADRQKLLDYAFRSLHVTAVAAKAIAQAYYGSAVQKAYFQGCSTGGRQALILAQRFPNDFDGIIAGAPVLNFSGTMASYARTVQALKAAPIASAKLPALAAKIYEGCDAKDGLKDGIIDDPRKCDFQPARDLPRCEAGADRPDCFTAGQVATLETIYSDMVVDGKRVFPGWPVGPEAAGPDGRSGWENWFVRSDGAPSTQKAFGETFFRFLAPAKPDPTFDLGQFVAERDVPKLENIHQILDATDTDLTRFQKRGGKLLMYYGWADPALNARMGLEYFEQVAKRMGPETGGFFRMYMMPGVFHCGGGVGAGSVNWLEPLVNWVEKGAAPGTLTATKVVQGKVELSRPVCTHPEVVKYKGAGNPAEAGSFGCVKP